MEIKTETKIVPTTVNRKVKTRVVVLTEKEALLIRDIIGSGVTCNLASMVLASFNYSKITDINDAIREINALGDALTDFAHGTSK